MRRALASVCVITALAMHISASADLIRFTNGVSVRGKVERNGDYAIIRTTDGLVLRVKRAFIASLGPEQPSGSSPSNVPTLPHVDAGTEEKPDVADVMSRPMSVDFQQMPLSDVVHYLRTETGLNFVIDPAVKADEVLITLSVKGMTLLNILRWIAHAGKLAIVIKGEGPIIRLAAKEDFTESVAVYNSRWATLSLIDRPAQPFHLAESAVSSILNNVGVVEQGSAFRRSARGRDIQDLDLPSRGRDLVSLLVRTTGAQNWDHAFVLGRLPAEDYLAGE